MLTLGRKKDQVLWIGDLEVTVEQIAYKRAFLRFVHDDDVTRRWIKEGDYASFFDDEVRVIMVRAERGYCRIGIQAPKNVPITRKETRH